MDKEFIADMLRRYGEHLVDVERAINGNKANYENNIRELERLTKFSPGKYEDRLEEMKEKVMEADKKLSHIVPRLEKIPEVIKELLG